MTAMTGEDYVKECFETHEFARDAPTWNRFGILGLGNIDENWNMGPHWRTKFDPINIPELRDGELQEQTKNFAECSTDFVLKPLGQKTKDGTEVSSKSSITNSNHSDLIG